MSGKDSYGTFNGFDDVLVTGAANQAIAKVVKADRPYRIVEVDVAPVTSGSAGAVYAAVVILQKGTQFTPAAPATTTSSSFTSEGISTTTVWSGPSQSKVLLGRVPDDGEPSPTILREVANALNKSWKGLPLSKAPLVREGEYLAVIVWSATAGLGIDYSVVGVPEEFET